MIKKKILAGAVDNLNNVLTQNARESQRFANEQLTINEIMANFKGNTEEKLAQLFGMNSHLQSRVDKQHNTINKLEIMCEGYAKLLEDNGNDIKTIKAFLGMMIDALDLHIEETPAVESKTYLVQGVTEKKVKKTKKTKK